jgi:hypothetical protein
MPLERVADLEFEHWIETTRATTGCEIYKLPDPSKPRLTSINLSMVSADDLFAEGLHLKQEENFEEAIRAFRSATQLKRYYGYLRVSRNVRLRNQES